MTTFRIPEISRTKERIPEFMDTIYVTGHRNPDTDSVVSAMAYAALRNSLGDRAYTAACLGRVNDETAAILNRFHAKAPMLLKNVRTQVCDLEFDTPPLINFGVTISRAWQMIHRDNHISAIPVTYEDGTLYGMLSAGDIAAYDMSSVRNPQIRNIPLYNLLSVIEGRILNDAGEQVDSVSGEVTIALPTSCKNLLFSAKESIVICGDQPDMIRYAMELGVECVIVCQSEVSEELRAMNTPTCLISTPFDAYRTVRLICHSLPVSRICKKETLVAFHLDDYIDDVRETVLKSRFRCYPILDENELVVGTLSRYHLLRPKRKKVVLVDHNEMSQAVLGLEQAEILEIIDHHRLADIQTGSPIYVRNEPVGSTTTIVAGMYQDRGLMPSETMAGLMVSAILSDTVMFKSPTCTQRDIDMANRMARIANVSLDELGRMIFSAASSENRTAEELLMTDFKEFHIAGHDLGISQITCTESNLMLTRKDELVAALVKLRDGKQYDLAALMLTDVLQEGSRLFFAGDDETIEQAFNCKTENGVAFLPRVMSRKKQVIPALSALWG
jgi:manganese-dependent inorganic pyrophosphatase